MNRRLHSTKLSAFVDGTECLFKCDECSCWFVTVVFGGHLTLELLDHHANAVNDAWCRCKPWDMAAVEIGMELPQGRVVYIDRQNSVIGLVDRSVYDPDSPRSGMRKVPFAEVGSPG